MAQAAYYQQLTSTNNRIQVLLEKDSVGCGGGKAMWMREELSWALKGEGQELIKWRGIDCKISSKPGPESTVERVGRVPECVCLVLGPGRPETG